MKSVEQLRSDLVLSKANNAYWKYLDDHKAQLLPGVYERMQDMMPKMLLLTTHVERKLDEVEVSDLA